MAALDEQGLDLLFRHARTHNGWQDKPVDDALLHRLYDLVKWGPTSSNCCPMRIVFAKSQAAKEKLKPCLAAGNVEKTMAAPATAIVAYDLEFYDKLPVLSPHNNAISWFVGKPEKARAAAQLNGTLQGGYFILAARALGLDCGPMSGFDNAKADEAFFGGSAWKSSFLCNLGYGDPSKLYPRAPRLDFNEACRIE